MVSEVVRHTRHYYAGAILWGSPSRLRHSNSFKAPHIMWPRPHAGVFSLSWHQPTYDPGMSDRKTRLTVTVDPHLAAYAEQLVEAGKAPSVSAVFNDALAERVERDKRIRRRWKEAAERADPEKVDRMIAHLQARAAVLPSR